jgi:hypothetical protein
MVLHLGAEGDVAVGVAKIGKLLLYSGGIGEREIAMAADNRQPFDMRQRLALDLGRGALKDFVEIDPQGGHGRDSACRLWRDVPFDTLDAPRRPDFSREAKIAAISNSCVGNEIRQPPELESITLPRPDYRRCRGYAI